MNGYFKLQVNTNNTSVILYPPTAGGQPISTAELLQYLAVKQIPCDVKTLGRALENLTEVKEVVLNLDKRHPEPEMFHVSVSPDRMLATARFYPPSNSGQFLGMQDIIRDLGYQNITYGIDEKAIKDFLESREYCTDIVLARGKEPVQGKDAVIEYFFNTDLRIKPTLLDDGSVDFFNLNTLNHCSKGDLLARLTPEVPGVDGFAINGDIVKAREVKRNRLRFGRNITINEDKTEITADVDGHVTLVNDSVFVSNVYEVENVDNSTGNIDYDGSVKINGNVMMNFTVKARGNIEVVGVVEGATLEAGGDIIISRGMKGMGKGVLKAGGNIICKFLENANAYADGYIETEAVLHSTLRAKTEVILTGRRAFITGGKVTATNKVSMKTLGSAMGADTIIEVGIDPIYKEDYLNTQKEIMEKQKTLKQMQPVIVASMQKVQSGVKLPPDQLKYIQSISATVKQLKEELEQDYKKMEDLAELLEQGTDASIVVTDSVYPGTLITISDTSLTVKDVLQHCKFVKKNGEVVMTAL